MESKNKKSLIVSSIIAAFIAITPYLLYVPNGIPEDVEYLDTFLGTLKGGHYGSVQVFVYFLLSKLVPLILFFIWFITCTSN